MLQRHPCFMAGLAMANAPNAREGVMQLFLSYKDTLSNCHMDEPPSVLTCLGGAASLVVPRLGKRERVRLRTLVNLHGSTEVLSSLPLTSRWLPWTARPNGKPCPDPDLAAAAAAEAASLTAAMGGMQIDPPADVAVPVTVLLPLQPRSWKLIRVRWAFPKVRSRC